MHDLDLLQVAYVPIMLAYMMWVLIGVVKWIP